MIFNWWTIYFSGSVLYSAFTSSEIGKLFLDLYFYFSWTTPLKFTLITFVRLLTKTTKIYNQATCLSAFQKWAKCQKQSSNQQMPKTLMKTRKIYNRATCLCAFRKWAKCQKRLNSTELDKECRNRSTSERKMKNVVTRQPTLSANCKRSVYTD